MVITCDVFDVCLLCLIFIIIKYLSQEGRRSMSVSQITVQRVHCTYKLFRMLQPTLSLY